MSTSTRSSRTSISPSAAPRRSATRRGAVSSGCSRKSTPPSSPWISRTTRSATPATRRAGHLARRREPRRGQARAQQRERMPPEGEAERGVIRGDTLGFGGRGDERTALPEIGAAGGREAERHGALGGGDLPEREVTVAAE